MRRIFFLFLFILLAACAAQTHKPTSALVESNSYLWDFGKIKEGEVLQHNFIFKNTSKKPLNIKNISTSCGCTASQAKKKNLIPGEETAIEVKFNTKGYSGRTEQFIYVNTDSADEPVVKFTIKAEVIKK